MRPHKEALREWHDLAEECSLVTFRGFFERVCCMMSPSLLLLRVAEEDSRWRGQRVEAMVWRRDAESGKELQRRTRGEEEEVGRKKSLRWDFAQAALCPV